MVYACIGMAGRLAEWARLESKVEDRWGCNLEGVTSAPDVLRPGVVEEEEEFS